MFLFFWVLNCNQILLESLNQMYAYIKPSRFIPSSVSNLISFSPFSFLLIKIGNTTISGLCKAKGKILLDNAVLNTNRLSIQLLNSISFHGFLASGKTFLEVLIFNLLPIKSGGYSPSISTK